MYGQASDKVLMRLVQCSQTAIVFNVKDPYRFIIGTAQNVQPGGM